jgi:spore photoproduct lyase
MKFHTVYIENAIKDTCTTADILHRIGFARKEYISSYKKLIPDINFTKCITDQKKDIILARNPGTFIKKCIRDKESIKENEFFLYPFTGCPMDCQYCYLQDYLDTHALTVFVNRKSYYRQLREFLKENSTAYVHAGEVCDPFVMERICPYLEETINIFSSYEKSFLEIRSKTLPPELFFSLKGCRNIIISETLSPKDDIREYERGTAGFESRLSVLEKCREQGFSVAIRLDPIIYSIDFRKKYNTLLEKVFARIPARNMSSISLGALRLTRDLYSTIRLRFPHSRILTGEFLQSPSGKIKYFTPYRDMLYQHIISVIRKHISKKPAPRLSLSMDSRFENYLD